MRKPIVLTTKIIVLLIGLNGTAFKNFAQNMESSKPHEMQHGFVLAADDKFASHLVAPGHHSRQVEITGQLVIYDQQEIEIYHKRKLLGASSSYFLFQAQNLDLQTLSIGQVLKGHIVESKIGEYQPKNKIVGSATFQVHKVLLNIPNPFFIEELQVRSSNQYHYTLQQENNDTNGFMKAHKSEKKHCCETGAKPCNWKC